MLCFVRSGFLIFCLLFVSCDKRNTYLKAFSSSSQDLEFVSPSHPKKQKELFKKSFIVYKGSPLCNKDQKCLLICEELFASKKVKKQCQKLASRQIYQIDKLYKSFVEKDFIALQNVNVFDLKVFLSLSGQPLFAFFKTLDSVTVKKILLWIAKNWQVAFVFREEDPHFLFLEIFLNKLNQSPINSLKEKLEEQKTFMEWAWLRNNDPALFWIDDYFHQKSCEGVPEPNCVLSHYCLVSQSFQAEFQKEFAEFERLKDLLKNKDLQSFCPNTKP